MDKKTKTRNIVISLLVIASIVIVVLNLVIPDRDTTIDPEQNVRNVQETVYNVNEPPPYIKFFMTRQRTRTGILDYTWLSNSLIIATSDGIYDAGLENISYWDNPITAVNFNTNGKGIFQSLGTWYVFDAATNTSDPITISGETPLINDEGTQIASQTSENTVSVFTIGDNDARELQVNDSITSFQWVYNTNDVAVVTSNNQNPIVTIFGSESGSQAVSLPLNSRYLDINPTGTHIAYELDGNLQIVEIATNDIYIVAANEESTISGNWITNSDFILIESLFDRLERPVDILSKVDTNGIKTHFTTSVAIPNKVDTSQYLKVDSSLNVLPIIENDGVVWFLGLISYTKVEYIGSSINFFPIDPDISDPDDGH